MRCLTMRLAVAIASAAVLACGGGGADQSADTALHAPVLLGVDENAAPWFDFENPVLWWTPPARADWLELEYGVEGEQPFPLIAPMHVDAPAMLALGTRVPELAPMRIRMRTGAWNGVERAYSDWVELRWTRGIRPPAGVRCTATTGTAERRSSARAEWSNASSSATDLRVERVEVLDGTVSELVRVMPVAFGATSYDDLDVRTGRSYRYRVSYGAGGTWSAAAETGAVRFAIVEPVDVRVQVENQSVRVGWTRRMDLADEQVVSVSNGAFARVPFDATSWVDATWPPWPGQRYAVGVVAGGTSARSSPATLPPFAVDAAGMTFDAAGLELRGSGWISDGAGGWWVDEQTQLSHLAGGTWTTTDAPERMGRVLRVGPDGSPHWLGAADYYGSQLTYRWRDAAGWNSETFETGRRDSFPAMEIDRSGVPHVVYVAMDAAGAETVVHRWRTGPGSWATDTLPAPGADAGQNAWIAFGASGATYVLVSGHTSPTLTPGQFCERSVAGAWSCTASGYGGYGGTYGRGEPVGMGAVGDTPALLHVDGANVMSWCERAAADWSCTGVAKVARTCRPSFAVDPRTGRVAIVSCAEPPVAVDQSAGPIELRVRDGAAWTAATLAPRSDVSASLRAGFDRSGKLWAVAANGQIGATSTWLER